MAGTTGLEPATSAVTVSVKTVTLGIQTARMARFGALKNPGERLLCPYCAHALFGRPLPICGRGRWLFQPLPPDGRGFGVFGKSANLCPRDSNLCPNARMKNTHGSGDRSGVLRMCRIFFISSGGVLNLQRIRRTVIQVDDHVLARHLLIPPLAHSTCQCSSIIERY